LAPPSVIVDAGSQVSLISLNGRFLELSLRERNSIVYHQATDQPLSPKNNVDAPGKKIKKEALDVTVNEQLVGFIPQFTLIFVLIASS